jgi:lysophospholipase L1-like esterase
MKSKHLSFVLLPLLLSSCKQTVQSSSASSAALSSSSPKYLETTVSVPEHIDYFDVQGRLEVFDDCLALDYSGSSLTFTADCQGEVSVKAESAYTNYDESSNGKRGLTLFSVFVDGERTKKNLALDNEGKDLILAEDLLPGTHVFSLVRQTNVYMSICNVFSISFSGSLLPTKKKKHFIEYIGDSYTSGYSLQGVKEGGGYDSSFDDPIDAFAYTSAALLDSGYSLTAFSGAGFAYGYTPFAVPKVYPYANYFRNKTVSYGPDTKADLVVINLGTNDVSQVGFDNNHKQIEEGIKTLVTEAFDAYGGENIPLLFCTDSTHENNDSLITEAMSSYLPDVPYKMIELTTNNQKNNYHPDAECGHIQGKELASAIKDLLPSVFGDQ